MKLSIFIQKTFLILLSAFVLAGCATSIEGIKSSPEKYAGADVVINTTVELEVPLPFMDYSLYRVSDATGEMFLFTTKKYMIGEKFFSKVHVIGINEKNSKNAVEQIAQDTAAFLVDNKITDESKARNLAAKLVRLISTLGSMAEGSYFLIAK